MLLVRALLRQFADSGWDIGQRADPGELDMPLSRRLRHLVWMLQELLKDGSVAKARAWTGFVHGALWALGFMTINDLSKLVAADKPPEERHAGQEHCGSEAPTDRYQAVPDPQHARSVQPEPQDDPTST